MPVTLTIFEDEISFDPIYAPGSGRPTTPKIIKSEFADGYTQVVKDGINNNRRSWNLRMEALSPSEFQEIDEYLKARGGWETFSFQPPSYEGLDPDTAVTDSVTVHCPNWTPTFLRGGHVNLQMTFEERFV